MQSQDVPMAPPAFPKLPKSALFSKLQSFLPVMEQENKKLEEAVAAGEIAKHSIEVDEDEAQVALAENEGGAEKPPVIEMNFALGMMENEKSDSGDDSSDDDEPAQGIDLKTSIMAATGAQLPQSGDKESSAFDLKLSRESTKSRPMIQELN
ncbi:hypothetical protein Gpo141_00012202 [Globisporangium polare]